MRTRSARGDSIYSGWSKCDKGRGEREHNEESEGNEYGDESAIKQVTV